MQLGRAVVVLLYYSLETGDACMLAMSSNPLCAVGVAPLFTCPSYVAGLETEPEDI